MVRRKCDGCGVTFESEGHGNGLWLNLCKRCNAKKNTLGKFNVGDSDRKLRKILYNKLRK